MTAGISIIVPIFGRTRFCQSLLESFSKTHKPDLPVEFLLVDNSTDSADSEQLESLARQYDVTYLHSDRGVVRARNKGAACARYRHLLFVDSDCTFASDTLLAYAALIRKEDPACAAGKTAFQGKESAWWKGIKDMVYFYPFRWCEWDLKLTWSPSCNLLIRADVFAKVGGFQSFASPREVSEDVDICLRIGEAGYPIDKCPSGLIYHTTETWNSLKSILSHFYLFGKGQTEMILKHKLYVNALPTVTGMFWMLILPLIIAVCLKFWTTAICLGLAIVLNPIIFILLQWMRPKEKPSFWNLLMHSVVETCYETGKLQRSISRGRFFLLKNHVFSFEMVMGLWIKNIDLFITYCISFLSIILYLCLK